MCFYSIRAAMYTIMEPRELIYINSNLEKYRTKKEYLKLELFKLICILAYNQTVRLRMYNS